MTKKRVSTNPLAFAEMCWLLTQGEWSRQELEQQTGVAESTIRKWLKYLRRPGKKCVYICERRVTANVGATRDIFTWGDEPDAPKRKNAGDAVHSRRYRERKLLRAVEVGHRTSVSTSASSPISPSPTTSSPAGAGAGALATAVTPGSTSMSLMSETT